LNAPQPGELVTTTTTTAMKTAVERRAIATARVSFETWAVAPPRIRELRLSFSGLLQDGGAVRVREPGLLQLPDRAVWRHPGDCDPAGVGGAEGVVRDVYALELHGAIPHRHGADLVRLSQRPL